MTREDMTIGVDTGETFVLGSLVGFWKKMLFLTCQLFRLLLRVDSRRKFCVTIQLRYFEV